MFQFFRKSVELPDMASALPGRSEPIDTAVLHHVNGRALKGPYPAVHQIIYLGLGCFWGAERLFWPLPGVTVTAVGYLAGLTPNPTYQEVCTGRTGHNEVVMIVYDPEIIPVDRLLTIFFEGHDPTQGMRQGNDVGTQYRSGIYVTDNAQKDAAIAAKAAYEISLRAHGRGPITTEILDAPDFYFAEGYHQQYLAKNPGGYCGLGGTGIACPVGTTLPA